MRRARILVVVAAVLGAAAACLKPTEITLDLSTDIPCAQIAANGTRIRVGRPGAEAVREVTTNACNASQIGTLVLVPSGGEGDSVSLEVIAGATRAATACSATSLDGCVLARRVLKYAPHTPLRLPIAMRQSCIGIPCSADQTCVQGTCRSATVDPGTCTGAGCDESSLSFVDGGAPIPPVDGGAPISPVDGSAPIADASFDAPLDATVDGGLNLPITTTISAFGGVCGLNGVGQLQCWGPNDVGQMGTGTTSPAQLSPVAPLVAGPVVAMAEGDQFACALLQGGRVQCWGNGTVGALGDGKGTNSTTPVDVLLAGPAIELSATLDHACALLASGKVQCWGSDGAYYGGNPVTTLAPITVPGFDGAVHVAAGAIHTCAILSGSVYCIGTGIQGQLGDGNATNSFKSPVAVVGLPAPATSITSGGVHSCAVLTTGAVYCWGANSVGQIGSNAVPVAGNSIAKSPVLVTGLGPAAQVGAAAAATCARLVDGTVQCWGSDDYGEQGSGALQSPSPVPVVVKNVAGALEMVVGHNIACARTSSSVLCWGYNGYGQLGRGTMTPAEPLAAPVVGFP